MLKLCIWMNIPSHYQFAFFDALNQRDDVDLQVRYFKGVSSQRAAEGWHTEYACAPFEKIADESEEPDQLLKTLPDWEDRIHLISSYFHSELIDRFCAAGVRWCHWSEMPGIRLAALLGFRMSLYRLLNPLMLFMKKAEGSRIQKHALGAFGQGKLAEHAFRTMGVSGDKIANLFYVPEPLAGSEPCAQIREFSKGRNVFLAVGALCRRKGIDVLIKAFASLKTDDWCLVLCGLDTEDGVYHALASRLGADQQVLFLGAFPSARIAEVYAAADVFVLASRFDGWGAVLNEAASVGLPVIGTDLCGSSWHLVDPGKTGYRARAGSVKSLASAMREYVSAPEKIAGHGSAAKELYFNTFTPGKNAERLVSVLSRWESK